MDFPHVTVELVLSWKWTMLTREGLAAVAARDRAPELLRRLVDRVLMTIEVSGPCEGFCAPWPIARNSLVWSASAGGHVMNVPVRERARGGGLPKLPLSIRRTQRKKVLKRDPQHMRRGIPALALKKKPYTGSPLTPSVRAPRSDWLETGAC